MPNGFELLARPLAPDILGAFEQGRAQRRQIDRERLADQELREQIERGNQFRQLAGQAFTAQPDQRQQIIGQAATADPQAALALENQFTARDRSQQDLMLERMGITAAALVNAPEHLRPALYKSMLPELRKFVPNAPEEYDPGMIPVARQFLQMRSGQPAQLQYFQQMTQGLSPEEVEQARRVALGIEGRASSAGMSPEKVTGPDGRQYFVVFDPRTGGARPVSVEELFGGQSPVAMAPQTAGAPAPQPGTPFAGLTPAEKAAQEAQARASVELQMQPQITAATKRAEIEAKRQEQQVANATVWQAYTQGMGSLQHALANTTTGFFSGRLPAVTASQQIADGAQAVMSPLLKQIFRTAGEGTFTDRDQELLNDMLPKRTDAPEAAIAKIDMVNSIVAAKLGMPPPPSVGRSTQQQPTAAPVRVSSPQERDALPPGTQYIAPDGSVRTKQ